MRRGRFFRSTDGIRTNEVRRDKIQITRESESVARATTTDNFFILHALFCSSLSLARARACGALYVHTYISVYSSPFLNDCTLNSTDDFLLSLSVVRFLENRTHRAKVYVPRGEFVQGALTKRVRETATQRWWDFAAAKSDGARTEDGFLWRSVGVAESGGHEEREDDGKLFPGVAEEEGYRRREERSDESETFGGDAAGV